MPNVNVINISNHVQSNQEWKPAEKTTAPNNNKMSSFSHDEVTDSSGNLVSRVNMEKTEVKLLSIKS